MMYEGGCQGCNELEVGQQRQNVLGKMQSKTFTFLSCNRLPRDKMMQEREVKDKLTTYPYTFLVCKKG